MFQVQYNGRSYVIEYSGTVKPRTIRNFCSWANTPEGVKFMHDAHHELLMGLERRRIHSRKPPQISGYALAQWTRFIYGSPYTNDYGPLFAKLFAAAHPEFAHLFKTKS